MQFSTLVISAITVIASVHGASIPAMDPSTPSQVALEARSYNDPNSGSNLEKRSPGYGGMSSGFNHQMGLAGLVVLALIKCISSHKCSLSNHKWDGVATHKCGLNHT
ncbi:hypothetical protein BASA62_007331 [Batrachochytrium salamandrivorans]|nr:hypothetical protein BASA62_007331 [Batrachochytrium salamandrivorans]